MGIEQQSEVQPQSRIKEMLAVGALCAASLGLAGSTSSAASEAECEPITHHSTNDWEFKGPLDDGNAEDGLNFYWEVSIPATEPGELPNCPIEVTVPLFSVKNYPDKFPQVLDRMELKRTVIAPHADGAAVTRTINSAPISKEDECELQPDVLVTKGVPEPVDLSDPKYDEIDATTLEFDDFLSWFVSASPEANLHTPDGTQDPYFYFDKECEKEEPEPTTTTTTTVDSTTTTVQQPSSTVPTPTTVKKPVAPAPAPKPAPAPASPRFTG